MTNLPFPVKPKDRFQAALNSPTARANRLKATGDARPLADQARGSFGPDGNFYGAGVKRPSSFPVRPKGMPQAQKVAAGLQRQKDINANNFPVKPKGYAPQLGGNTFTNLRPPQAATGAPMGILAGTPAGKPASPVKPSGAAAAPSGFVGPPAPEAAPLLPAPQTAGNFPVKPRQAGKGYSAYVDEQLGGAGWKMSTKDSKSGFVAQDGAYKGQTKQAAMGMTREKFLAMSPEERAKYDEQAEVLGGVAGRPEESGAAVATGAAQHAAVVNRQPAGAAVAGIAVPGAKKRLDEDGDESLFAGEYEE